MRTKIYQRLKISLLIVLYMCSCQGNRTSDKQIFHYNQAEGIGTLDPAFAKNQPVMWASHQLYNTLVEIDQKLHIVPSLAKHWTISDDGKTYTFFLRDDVFFNNNAVFTNGKGRKMIAADIAFSLGRIIDKNTASPGAWIFNNRVDSTEPFKAINDTTFQLKMQFPFPPIMGILSMQYCSIVAHEAVEKYGKDFRRNPCGTGPFYLKDWEEGQAMILLKNENYFEKDSTGRSLPYLDAVKVTFLDSKATEFLEFQQGRLDFINDIDATFKDEVLTKKEI